VALPPKVPLAWAHCGDAGKALLPLGDEGIALEAAAVQQLMLKSWPQERGCSAEAWVWAWSLVHSRSFRDERRHFIVPGVDLANHSFSPSATVRVVWDPDNCQGVSASADVCDGPRMDAAEGRIELLAGDDGISAGEEVTISYGPWPSDVWALFYGFVPYPNPHDRVMLFSDLQHLADFATSQFGPTDFTDQQRSGAAKKLLRHLKAGLGGDCQRLFMTANGFDERLSMAAQRLVALNSPVRLAWPAAHMSDKLAPDQPLQPGDILAARMSQMLQVFDTASSEALEAASRAGDGREAVLTCIAHRRQLLAAGISALWGDSAAPP